MDLWRVPPVMVIQLKRFQYTQNSRRKLRSFVDFPLHGLDLSPFLRHTPGGGAQHFEQYPSAQPDEASDAQHDEAGEQEETCEAISGDVTAAACAAGVGARNPANAGSAENADRAAGAAGARETDGAADPRGAADVADAGDAHDTGVTEDVGNVSTAGDVGDASSVGVLALR